MPILNGKSHTYLCFSFPFLKPKHLSVGTGVTEASWSWGTEAFSSDLNTLK